MIGAPGSGGGGGEFMTKITPPLCLVVDAEVVEEDKTVGAVNEEAGNLGSENLDSSIEGP